MNNKFKTAFTLVELLVVIAIIGILSGLIIVGMNNSVQSATIAKAQIFSASLRDSMLANLVSEWKFDNISGTVDTALADSTAISDTWGNSNGSTFNGPTLRGGTNCMYGQCLQFDGTNDYVAISNYSIFLPHRNNFTVEFWMNASNVASQSYRGIIDQGNGNSNNQDGWRIWFISNDHLGFHMGDGTNSLNGISSGSMKLNTWYHVALVVNRSSGYTFYLNGIKSGTLSIDTSTYDVGTADPRQLYFGRVSWIVDPTTNYAGYLDNVRIYNDIMPASLIEQHYYSEASMLLSKKVIKKDDYIKIIKNI